MKTRDELWKKVTDIIEPDLRIHFWFDSLYDQYKKTGGLTFTEEMLIGMLTDPNWQTKMDQIEKDNKTTG